MAIKAKTAASGEYSKTRIDRICRLFGGKELELKLTSGFHTNVLWVILSNTTQKSDVANALLGKRQCDKTSGLARVRTLIHMDFLPLHGPARVLQKGTYLNWEVLGSNIFFSICQFGTLIFCIFR